MNLTIQGLWHLGCITAACCARHFRVTGLDFDPGNIAALQQGRAPLFEPGLNELITAGLDTAQLTFTTDPALACGAADVLWLTYDTPVDEHDRSNAQLVVSNLRHALPHLRAGALVLISSQLPVGTCRGLETEYPQIEFACSPENLRLGRAIEAFEKAERVIVGVRNEARRKVLEDLFKPFTPQVLFMRTESAEMVKHALNSFLALSITFINEVARLCEHVGADAQEVSAGLRSEPRIGRRAYLGPGGPFAGGTLARDVVTLTRLGEEEGEPLCVIPAIKHSNDQHRGWALRRLQARLGSLRGKRVAVLGLVYTPNTDTLRRSAAVELCQTLLAEQAQVRASDPAVQRLPTELQQVHLSRDLRSALADADAAVVCTEWPQFREVDWAWLLTAMRQRVVLDANRFLEKQLDGLPGIEYLSVGRV